MTEYDENSPIEQQLLTRYRRELRPQEPSAALDHAILEMARQQAQTNAESPKSSRHPGPAWQQVVSIAASVVVVVSLAVIMKQEISPDQLMAPPVDILSRQDIEPLPMMAADAIPDVQPTVRLEQKSESLDAQVILSEKMAAPTVEKKSAQPPIARKRTVPAEVVTAAPAVPSESFMVVEDAAVSVVAAEEEIATPTIPSGENIYYGPEIATHAKEKAPSEDIEPGIRSQSIARSANVPQAESFTGTAPEKRLAANPAEFVARLAKDVSQDSDPHKSVNRFLAYWHLAVRDEVERYYLANTGEWKSLRDALNEIHIIKQTTKDEVTVLVLRTKSGDKVVLAVNISWQGSELVPVPAWARSTLSE